MEEIRINKYLSDIGFCSRRQADKLIDEGNVTVNGIPCVMGQKVTGEEDIRVSGKPVKSTRQEGTFTLIAFNKPVGIVCTSEKREKDNIIDFINYPTRIYPIGRLDKNSEGLILLTDNGDIVNRMMRSGNMHEKEYLVSVNHDITDEFLEKMRSGVAILDTVTRPCIVTKLSKRKFKIILTQGLNRQIRRMCEALDYRVTYLKRVRVINIELGDLKSGEYRDVVGKEREELLRIISNSSNTTVIRD
ncbi:MAG: pseudouridine synthase [Lachnospiraceae bacterium]|jgi:23S rRNA pseudouridine2604 synthase|nr:pseudouridine synthase [Lachnospiraceae bacterium]